MKATLIALAVAVAAGAAGWLVLSHYEVFASGPESNGAGTRESATSASGQPDDSLNQRRADGVGSIKKLKPVPLSTESGKPQ